MALATWILRLLAAYCVLGLAFAIPFVLRGAGRLDPAARHAGRGFRLLILPGSIALWPLLLRRWWRSSRGATARPVERNAHRDAAGAAR